MFAWKLQNFNVMGFSLIGKDSKLNLIQQKEKFGCIRQVGLNGLVVWFLLRVQEVPGSNPGWAPDFCNFFLWNIYTALLDLFAKTYVKIHELKNMFEVATAIATCADLTSCLKALNQRRLWRNIAWWLNEWLGLNFNFSDVTRFKCKCKMACCNIQIEYRSKHLCDRPWQDLNLQSPVSETDALSIRPQGRYYYPPNLGFSWLRR